MARHPSEVPLGEWSDGWLALEIARLADKPEYLWMHPAEKSEAGLPVSHEEMLEFVKERRA